jgi:hypothetical protein
MTRLNTLAALGASACLVFAATAATAMPVDQDYYAAPGVTKDGRLDIKEVHDNSTEMEMRLSQQLMVLQRQISDLQKEIATIKAAMPQ